MAQPHTSLDQLQVALAISREMLAHAEQGEWGEIDAGEARRAPLIREALQADAIKDPRVADACRELLDLNHQIETRVLAARDASATEVRELGRGRKAVKAYNEVKR